MKHQALVLLVMIFAQVAQTQCTNTYLFPNNPISASQYNDTVLISNQSYAGDYMIIIDLIPGATYTFTSSIPGDYFTIRDAYDFSVLLGNGSTPFTFTPSQRDMVSVHLNLTSPPCGTENVYRSTKVVCDICIEEPGGIGINTIPPKAALDVYGAIKVGNAINSPEAGMIRWNSANSDFEGYNGNKWLSLTKSSTEGQWGQVPINEMNPDLKLTAGDGAAGDYFGSVSISGDYAIVGAWHSDVGSNVNQGSAYIFHRTSNTWSEQTKLVANDGTTSDQFGYFVCINGDYAIVGAPFDAIGSNVNQGSAYIFHRTGTTWSQQAKLIASDGAASDAFGAAVSISGDYAIIGANSDAIGSNVNQGSAYIFQRSGSSWSQQAKLVASDGAASDKFGEAVSIDGNYAIIGANSDDIGSNVNQGSAYIFQISGSSWSQQAKLVASDGAASDQFGYSVCINGDYAIIGAPLDVIGSNLDQGSAYIFQRTGATTWAQQEKITAGDGQNGDYFGISVSVNVDFAMIGSVYGGSGDGTQGAAYLFNKNGNSWNQTTKFVAQDGENLDHFGSFVSISDDQAIIGASHDDIGSIINQGSAFIVEKK